MLYAVTHTTNYLYTDPVSLCHNLVHLRPRPAPRQTCHHATLLVQPEPRALVHQHDYFGNPIAFFTIQEPYKKLTISMRSRLEVVPLDAMPLGETPAWEEVRAALQTDRTILDAYSFTFDSPYVKRSPALAEYAAPSFAPGRPILDAAADLSARIHREIRFVAKSTTISTPVAEVLAHRHGVCQDFAHLAIGCLRSFGLAARYVSGYLETRPPPGRERLVGADASHAWLAVFAPGLGWVDFDPTNNLLPSERHLTVAWGRDYGDVSPICGVIIGGSSQTMTVSVDVAPVLV